MGNNQNIVKRRKATLLSEKSDTLLDLSCIECIIWYEIVDDMMKTTCCGQYICQKCSMQIHQCPMRCTRVDKLYKKLTPKWVEKHESYLILNARIAHGPLSKLNGNVGKAYIKAQDIHTLSIPHVEELISHYLRPVLYLPEFHQFQIKQVNVGRKWKCSLAHQTLADGLTRMAHNDGDYPKAYMCSHCSIYFWNNWIFDVVTSSIINIRIPCLHLTPTDEAPISVGNWPNVTTYHSVLSTVESESSD